MRASTILSIIERFAAWLLLAVAVIFGVDVTARYVFGYTAALFPDLEWYGVCLAVCLSFAPALSAGAHVGVELIAERLSMRARRLILVIGHIGLLLPWVAFVCYAGGRYAINSWLIGEGSADPGGLGWRWFPKFCVVLGFTLLGLEALRQVLRASAPTPFLPEADSQTGE